MSKSRTRRWFQRWHRRVGIFSALILLLLTFTGFLLNHSNDFGLDHKKLTRSQAAVFYLEQSTPTLGSYLPQGWIYQLDKQILLNSQALQTCESNFVGAVWIEQTLYIACEETLHVLDKELRLIESLNARLAYPAPVYALTDCGKLCLKSAQQNWLYDFHSGSFKKTALAPSWHTLKKLPEELTAAAPSAFSWERLILDIHAGRFLGAMGVWILDFFVLLFFVLSISGIYLWWKKENRNKKRRNDIKQG
ncbi:Uncharacterized iron-regulated membrane protein [Alteromonadaceae bacterium Bs31]|nr:Uncharacterized iron-regulated membrane protein [Alteromonadaceae bacterium Bs31]